LCGAPYSSLVSSRVGEVTATGLYGYSGVVAHIVPPDLVRFIDLAFPLLTENPSVPLTLSGQTVSLFSILLELLEEVPKSLVVLDSRDFATFCAARADIRSVVDEFKGMSLREKSAQSALRLGPLPMFDGLNSVALIRVQMVKCPEKIPAPGTSELTFIGDAPMRETLRLDISTVASALAHEEWKPATVLAGSVVEALLLWALGERKSDLAKGVTDAEGRGSFKLGKCPDPERLMHWDLNDYVVVAESLREIGHETSIVLNQVRGFRNLVHPGRAQRLGQICTRGTAHIAFGAMLSLIDDLKKRRG
jgi:hypothetical protein